MNIQIINHISNTKYTSKTGSVTFSSKTTTEQILLGLLAGVLIKVLTKYIPKGII